MREGIQRELNECMGNMIAWLILVYKINNYYCELQTLAFHYLS